MTSVTLQDIKNAAQVLRGQVVRTNCSVSRTLSCITGADVYIKFENHQFTAAFKERGALNKLVSLTPEQRERGVIAMSAGNHAQAVARHASLMDIHATIVMPRNTPSVKVVNTETLGAEVILEGGGVAQAGEHAQRIARERGYCFVHPYDDQRIIAGQGTIALEMLEDCPFLEQIIVPVGGGGLISGMAVAAKALSPDVEVIGVQAKRFPSMHCWLRGEQPVYGTATIADGIAVTQPGRITRELIKQHVDAILLADEPDLERAVLLLLEIEKTVAEGAGGAGLAAMLAHPERFRGRRVGLVLCGGNIDLLRLSAVIERGLVRTQRVVRVRAGIPDEPGALAHLTRLLAGQSANIVKIAHQRAFTDLSIRSAEVELVLETLGGDHLQQILWALRDEGYDAVVSDAGPHPSERGLSHRPTGAEQ